MHTLSLLLVKYPVHLQIQLVLQIGESAWIAIFFQMFFMWRFNMRSLSSVHLYAVDRNGSFMKMHLFCIIPE